MFRKLSSLSLPVTPRTPREPPPSSKPKSQTLICSAAMPYLGAKSAPKALQKQQVSPPAPPEEIQLPPETVISILDGFAKTLLMDSERLALLKAKCNLNGKLGQEPAKGSILRGSHTVLTYLSWGVKHIQKAASAATRESRVEHLKKAEQMLRTLTDSMQDLDQGVLLSTRVPNASYIVGLAHVFLALVWKMRKNNTRSVASHLLEAFMVCPKNARHTFAPELWEQLFRPPLSGVEAWYKKEHNNIVNNYSRSLSTSIRSSPSYSPMPPAIARGAASSPLMNVDVAAGMNSKRSSVTESKRSEKINMQANLLYDLYEESLDEGTQQYARHYHDLISSYYDRFSHNNSSRVLLQHGEPQPSTFSLIKQAELELRATQAAAPVHKDDSTLRRRSTLTSEGGGGGGGWMGENTLQLRRSVYGAVFGMVSLEKKNKKGASNQASLLRLCNKELPQVLDPNMRNLEEGPAAAAATYNNSQRKGSSKVSSLADDVNSTPKVEYKHRRSFQGNARRLIDLIEDSESDVPATPFRRHNRKPDGQRTMPISGVVVDRTIIDEADHLAEAATAAADQLRLPGRIRRSSFSNAESTMREKISLAKNRNHGVAARESLKDCTHAPKVPLRGGRSRHEMHRRSTSKLGQANDVQTSVKYCSLAVQKSDHEIIKGCSMAGQPPSEPVEYFAQPEVGGTQLNMEELARELREVVSASRSGELTSVGRCEEVLLRLSEAWLDCKSATLEVEGGAALDGLIDELLFILANSKLQEAQRLALCLLSASIARRKGQLQQEQSTLSFDSHVLEALSHLLQQHGRIPDAALLLQLLHPGKYSTACYNYLPHLLPLLLDLAQRNPSIDNCTTNTSSPFAHLRVPDIQLTSRALALMMMSRLLSSVDRISRLQTCKHILYPNAVPCLLHSLECAFNVDERAAAAFMLTTCMQADDMCRQRIVTEVKVTTVVALLQQCACSTSAFQTAINFVTEVLCSNYGRAYLTEMLRRIRQDGVLNCMHALMAYLQTASVENQPPAAGLLLQLDLLLGDEQRYSVFRDEALDALVAPLFSESNEEASFNAVHVLSTIGRSHSEQELEAWLLKKAGLASQFHSSQDNSTPIVQDNLSSRAEEESAAVAEWDGKVARTLIRQGGGQLVSHALAKGLRNSMAEVRKACLLVAAWLSSYLNMDQLHNYMSADAQAAAAERMKEALQPQLQAMAAVGSGCAIDERVFAALALQNLGM